MGVRLAGPEEPGCSRGGARQRRPRCVSSSRTSPRYCVQGPPRSRLGLGRRRARRPAGVPDRGDLLTVVSARGSVEAEGQVAAVVAASRLAAEVSAPLGEVLESIARALAAESEARADREASLAGPAATARVLLWLPLVGVLLGVALGWTRSRRRWAGPGVGRAARGAVLLLIGRRWSGRLVARARAVGAPP